MSAAPLTRASRARAVASLPARPTSTRWPPSTARPPARTAGTSSAAFAAPDTTQSRRGAPTTAQPASSSGHRGAAGRRSRLDRDDALAILRARRLAAGPDRRVRAGILLENEAGAAALAADGWTEAWRAPRLIRGGRSTGGPTTSGASSITPSAERAGAATAARTVMAQQSCRSGAGPMGNGPAAPSAMLCRYPSQPYRSPHAHVVHARSNVPAPRDVVIRPALEFSAPAADRRPRPRTGRPRDRRRRDRHRAPRVRSPRRRPAGRPGPGTRAPTRPTAWKPPSPTPSPDSAPTGRPASPADRPACTRPRPGRCSSPPPSPPSRSPSAVPSAKEYSPHDRRQLPPVRHARHPRGRHVLSALRASLRRHAASQRRAADLPDLLPDRRRRRPHRQPQPARPARRPAPPHGRARPPSGRRRRVARDAARGRQAALGSLDRAIRDRPPLSRHGPGQRRPQSPARPRHDRDGDDPDQPLRRERHDLRRPARVAGRPRRPSAS